MRTTERQVGLCLQAFAQWGVRAQMTVAMEECAELVVAISHHMRERPGSAASLAEEIADVELVCASMRQLVGDAAVDEIKAAKWLRLEARLDGAAGAPLVPQATDPNMPHATSEDVAKCPQNADGES